MTVLGHAGHERTPSGLKVAPTSYRKLEQVASGLRPLLPIMAGSGPWKVDASRILEQVLPKANYNFKVAERSELQECAAFTIPTKGLIVFREDVYDGISAGDVFSRSTVVHEMSHIVLNHAVTLHRGAQLGKHQFYEDSEWQAKALTVAIMMPIDACKAAQSPEELAELCGTSVVASTYRLEKLARTGHLNPNRFENDLFKPVTKLNH